MNAQTLMYKYRLACETPGRRDRGGDPIRMVRGVFSRWCAWKYKRVSESGRWGVALSARAAFSLFSTSIRAVNGRLVCDEAAIDRHIADIEKAVKIGGAK